MGRCEALDALEEKPVYPHSEWIADLLKESEVRKLTKGEVIAITEASMFENLITAAIPELREQVAKLPADSLEYANAQMYIEVAVDFAKGLSGDISVTMQKAFRSAVVGVKQ